MKLLIDLYVIIIDHINNSLTTPYNLKSYLCNIKYQTTIKYNK